MHLILKVRSLREGEPYYPAYAGKSISKGGEESYLSNPEAETIAALYNLQRAELQFEFFCYAYLRCFRDIIHYSPKYKLAEERYQTLRDKFKAPWYQQAKHVIPNEPFIWEETFTKTGDIDLEAIRQLYDELSGYSYVLFNEALYDDPEWSRLSDALSPLKETATTL